MVNGPLHSSLPIGASPDRRRRIPHKPTEASTQSSEFAHPSSVGLAAAFDACILSDISSSQGGSSPRSFVAAGSGSSNQLTLPVTKRASLQWCDIHDDDDEVDDFRNIDIAVAWSPSAKASDTPTKTAKRADRRRRQRDLANGPAYETAPREAPFAQLSPGHQLQTDTPVAPMAPAPVGPLSAAHGPAVVTLEDIGFGGHIGASPARAIHQEPWMAAGSPCRAQAGACGVMSTSPMTDRPRPAAVCLPKGALSFTGCTSPSASPAAGHGAGYGDASSRAPPATVSGDASTRQVPGTPVAANLMAASPKACYGTDASARTPLASPMGCHMPWHVAQVATQAAEAASPCRRRSPPGAGMVCTSPAALGHHGHCWSPAAGSPADALRVLLGPSDLPTGEELVARLQAAAPESYED
eukprot:gb/GFBE01036087.1/.p1 GENE.gb/GFBE01036087.1/~~gb/GFBE01036087.1/.p1  ORF type:complete len:412 (+),score=41.16 gb/GFBE01036087.1/:1-1236(+)